MSNTSKVDANTTSEGNELKLILQKLNKLDILTAEQGKLRESVDFCAENFDDTANKLNEVRQKLDLVIAENKMMRKKEKEDLKQYLRHNNLELHGIPVKENENIVDLVIQASSALGVKLIKEDIDACHHLTQRKPELPPPITVKFTRRLKKEEVMKAKKNFPRATWTGVLKDLIGEEHSLLHAQLDSRVVTNGRIHILI
ncbi:hypothetical protein PR048_021510 [Dryococelus australis]|uniref:Uncharacterized protein n=1 Tax=Dryococelus australis TaxID=614101 RepID=A0ABQ9GYL1_9NEOP|nr:hypothetical protein PR048_021510 [Dryococelus australis]